MRAGPSLSVAQVRVLSTADLRDAGAVLDADPVVNAFVSGRVGVCGLEPARLGAEVWGYEVAGRLQALCYSGANLVPVCAGPHALRAFAERAISQGRICSSIVGPADAVRALWSWLGPRWGPARELRLDQPLLATSAMPSVPPDPAVRRARPEDVEALLPACVAMYTEEVGVSPLGSDGGSLYRARVSELVAGGRSYVRIEDGRVLFKAEIGAATPYACQVQGVWVRPDRRGEGLGTAGMAAVVRDALRTVAPVVSLYVNDFNQAARAAYTRVGMDQVGTFASVLF